MDDAGEWMRLDDAAKALGVSDRTLRRHLSEGRYQVTQDEDGYKRVFVSDDRKMTGRSGQFPEDGQENAVILRQMADGAIELYREQLDHVHDQMQTVRRSAAIAWCCVGIVAIAIGICGWWAMGQHGRASLAEKDAETAATMAQDARRAVDDFKAILAKAQARAEAAEGRAAQQATEARQWAAKAEAANTKAEQAMVRAHNLALQIANLEAALERDRLAQAVQIPQIDSRGAVEVSPDTSTR